MKYEDLTEFILNKIIRKLTEKERKKKLIERIKKLEPDISKVIEIHKEIIEKHLPLNILD